MTIQFLDLRVSEQAENDTSPVAIPVTPGLLFGDIGLQIADVSPANAGDVRVLLTGYAKISGLLVGSVTISVFKNAIATPIFTTTQALPIILAGDSNIGFSTTDLPVPADFASGQIQYTARISASGVGVATVGARNFSGTAAAGTFTG